MTYFDMFWQIAQYRTAGMSGPDPIQPTTIMDWCKMTGNELREEEQQLLLRMDQAYRRKYFEMLELHRSSDKAKSQEGYKTYGRSDSRDRG